MTVWAWQWGCALGDGWDGERYLFRCDQAPTDDHRETGWGASELLRLLTECHVSTEYRVCGKHYGSQDTAQI